MNAIVSVAGMTPAVKVGRDAGWILSFHEETRRGVVLDPVFELSRDDYYGEITASLPGGLEGGSYTFVIEGLTDADYKKITLTSQTNPRVVCLYLYWRDLDVGDLGIVSNVLGSDFINGFQKTSKIDKHAKDRIAVLRIVSVTRRAGQRKYETTITARELVFDQVTRLRPCGDTIELKDLSGAVKELMRRAASVAGAEVPHKFHQAKPRTKPPSTDSQPAEAPDEKVDARQPIASALQTIATRMEQSSNRHGRGMLLIRDGTLHVGQRPIPIEGAGTDPKKLTLDQGLLEVEVLQRQERDPNWDRCTNSQKPAPTRAQYRLTLRGRPDLKPGDVVKFDAPKEEDTKDESTKSPLGGAFGALGDMVAGAIEGFTGLSTMKNPVELYVYGVEHRLGRTAGFTTKVTGIQVGTDGTPDDDEIWDAHTPVPKAQDKPTTGGARGTVEQDAADAVVRLFKRELGKLGTTDVAEVREFRAKSDGPKGGQASDVFRGLVAVKGPAASHRADIKRPSDAEAAGVPYLTPFAWGKCGLVLPRYPGMRVALTHGHFDNADPIDIGALWMKGHGPENAEAGDWWLSLPADKPTGNAPSPKTSGAPSDFAGATTHDLIDSSGNRVIEVGALVVRIGSSRLPSAGERPDKPDAADTVTIECPGSSAQDTWMLQIKKDGTVTLKGKSITLDASEKLTLKAPQVEVSCTKMEVK